MAAYTPQQKEAYLTAFANSLGVLNELNNARIQNDERKKGFTQFVIAKLEELRGKILPIIQQINGLKDQINNLQGQVDQNNGGIVQKDAQIADLTQQLERLNQESAGLRTQLDAGNQESVRLQGEIDERENRLRALQLEKDRIEAEKNAFDQQLRERGDAEALRAQQIEDLNNQHAAQMEQLQQEIQRLQQEIEQRDRQIAANDANAQQQQQDQQNNANAIQELNNRIAAIEGERNALQEENNDLIGRIIAATEAIGNAAEHLRELTDEGFYNTSREEVERKIGEIEAIIQQISNAIQGNGGLQVAAPQQRQRQQRPDRNRNININNRNMNVNDLLNNLREKGADVARNTGDQDNKYNKALRFIEETLQTTPNIQDRELKLVVDAAFNRNAIDFTNEGRIRGGYKTTRKHKTRGKKYTRRQKGGFLYGKYKKTSTIASSSTPSSKNTSSLLSSKSTSTSSKNKKNRGKGISKKHKRM